MLSCPEYGWSDFQLEGTEVYGLSYFDDIAFDWLEQAIHGLETMRPFCVKGFMEPGRFLCRVSYWNCHIVCEYDNRGIMRKEEIESNTSMLEFCELLHNDIKSNLDAWAAFVHYRKDEDLEEKKKCLESRLIKLSDLILARQEHFLQERCFL